MRLPLLHAAPAACSPSRVSIPPLPLFSPALPLLAHPAVAEAAACARRYTPRSIDRGAGDGEGGGGWGAAAAAAAGGGGGGGGGVGGDMLYTPRISAATTEEAENTLRGSAGYRPTQGYYLVGRIQGYVVHANKAAV